MNKQPNQPKLTDAELAKLLKDGGRAGAKLDFDKLLKRAAKPKK